MYSSLCSCGVIPILEWSLESHTTTELRFSAVTHSLPPHLKLDLQPSDPGNVRAASSHFEPHEARLGSLVKSANRANPPITLGRDHIAPDWCASHRDPSPPRGNQSSSISDHFIVTYSRCRRNQPSRRMPESSPTRAAGPV